MSVAQPTQRSIVIQLSDPHIDGGSESRQAFEAAVGAVDRFPGRPCAVLVTGDIADAGGADEYAFARATLARLKAPVHVIPGNLDDRAELRRAFDLPGAGGEPVLYELDIGPLRLVAFDTLRRGSHAGELDRPRLAWLESALEREPSQPTLIALHHPPLRQEIEAWDEIGLPDSTLDALGRIVGRNPQVRGLLAGHLHHTVFGQLAGRPVLAAPSTFLQVKLDVEMTTLDVSSAPPGFAVHVLSKRGLVSYIEPIPTACRDRN